MKIERLRISNDGPSWSHLNLWSHNFALCTFHKCFALLLFLTVIGTSHQFRDCIFLFTLSDKSVPKSILPTRISTSWRCTPRAFCFNRTSTKTCWTPSRGTAESLSRSRLWTTRYSSGSIIWTRFALFCLCIDWFGNSCRKSLISSVKRVSEQPLGPFLASSLWLKPQQWQSPATWISLTRKTSSASFYFFLGRLFFLCQANQNPAWSRFDKNV